MLVPPWFLAQMDTCLSSGDRMGMKFFILFRKKKKKALLYFIFGKQGKFPQAPKS
jgi:hypothetical protein